MQNKIHINVIEISKHLFTRKLQFIQYLESKKLIISMTMV